MTLRAVGSPVLLAFLVLAPVLMGPPEADADEEQGGAVSGPSDTTQVGGEGVEGMGAPADTALGAARRSGRRFAPNYTSRYDVNRNISNWTQGLSFSTWVGPVDVSSSTSVSIGKDKTLDRDRRNRSTNFGFIYNALTGFKVGSTLMVIRNQTLDPDRPSTGQNSERFNVNVDYNRTLIPDLTGAFQVSAGTSRDKRDDPLTSNRESVGPHAEASANFTLKRGADWSLRTALRNSRFRSTEERTGQTTRDNNLGADLGFSVDFKVPGFDSWKLTTGRRLNRTQYPFVVGDNAPQETNITINRDISLTASTTPRPRLGLSGTVSYRNNNVDREIDTDRSQKSIDRAADWRLGYQFPDSTSVELRQNWSIDRAVYEDTSRVFLNGDVLNRSLGGSVRRPLGDRANFDAAASYQVQSFLFDNFVLGRSNDRSANFDDRDVINGSATTNLSYQPIERVRANVRVSFQHTHTISINTQRSGNNQTQQSYTVVPSLEYQLTSWITFREEGTALANATVFDFNEDQNRLSRSTELRSVIDTRPMGRLGMNLRHAIRFLENGSYQRREDGVREFGKESDETSRDLTFRVDYTPITGVNVDFRTNKRVTDRVTLSLRGGRVIETPSSSEFTEIEIGSRVARSLDMGLTVGVDLKRAQSWSSGNVRNNFWLGSINISRSF